MSTDESRLIVEDAMCASCSVHTKRVHHREYPEIRAECGSLTEAVAYLIIQLTSARENIQSNWRRESIDRAIAEVTEIRGMLAETTQDVESACRCVAHVPDQIEPILPGRNTSL